LISRRERYRTPTASLAFHPPPSFDCSYALFCPFGELPPTNRSYSAHVLRLGLAIEQNEIMLKRHTSAATRRRLLTGASLYAMLLTMVTRRDGTGDRLLIGTALRTFSLMMQVGL
jgi:hypothetical protein